MMKSKWIVEFESSTNLAVFLRNKVSDVLLKHGAMNVSIKDAER